MREIKFREAMEKQIAKACICEIVDENGIEDEFEHYICPNCKDILLKT